MSKMNEMSMSDMEDRYAEHVEEQRQELRKEGAEELRQDILRELNTLVNKAWTSQEKHGYQTAIVVVERANI
jgi:uncharacterized protein YicC (UPF0701 family)